MRYKVASRVRGLSDEAFQEAFGTEEQCRAAAGPAALAGRLRLPLLRPSRALRAGGPGALSMQPVREADNAHGGPRSSTRQAAADTLVRRHPPDRDGEERHVVGGTRPPSRGQAADGLGREAQDHGGDGAARGETRLTGRVEMDDAYLGGVRSGGKRGRGAAGKTPFVAALSTSPDGRPRKVKLAPVKGLPQARDARGAKHWLAPGAAVVTDGLGCWSALDEAACSPGRPHRLGTQGGPRGVIQMGQYGARQHQVRGQRDLSQARPRSHRALPRQFHLALHPRYQLQTMIPRFVHSAARTDPMPYRLLIAG